MLITFDNSHDLYMWLSHVISLNSIQLTELSQLNIPSKFFQKQNILGNQGMEVSAYYVLYDFFCERLSSPQINLVHLLLGLLFYK